MRVAFLTQWLGTENNTFIVGIARALANEGVEVTFVTGDAPLGTTGRRRYSSPFGSKEEVGGLAARRYPYYKSHDSVSARRTATYLTFAASSTMGAVAELARHDVVLVYGSPATAAAAALAARRLRGTPFVFMVQDVWPDSIFAAGFLTAGRARRLAESMVGAYVQHVYRQSSQVVAITPSMRELLVSRGVPDDQAHCVYNWIEEGARLPVVTVPERRAGEPLRILYAGNMGGAQRLDVMIDAAALVGSDVEVTLHGYGLLSESLAAQVASRSITNVRVLPPVSRQTLATVMRDQHLHFVSLADDPLFQVTLPSKTQSLLAAGAPIIAAAPGEAADIVLRAGAGLACPPGDPQALADTLRTAAALPTAELSAMGARGLAFYEREMAQQVGAARLRDVLERASRDRSRVVSAQ